MFSRVFVANRATVARRVVRACNDLGLESIAAYADVDAAAPHLAEATATARLPGYTAAATYLNADEVIAAAKASGADALHPGYGFLAENADFARAVAAAGIRFIGPDARWIEGLGEKTRARATMAAAGFPVRGGSDVLMDADAAVAAAARIGYPVLLKPAAGGGGIGMLQADDETELASAFATARALAASAFGDGAVYLEKHLAEPRHIEFQVIGDGESTIGVFERECSVQRRHQKVIEEAPAPLADRERIAAVEAAAVAALAGYDSLGTVETLYADGNFGFWRSTPVCRSSTGSPKRSRASTSWLRRSASRPAAAWRTCCRSRSNVAATRSRRASMPRIRSACCRRPAGLPCSGRRR